MLQTDQEEIFCLQVIGRTIKVRAGLESGLLVRVRLCLTDQVETRTSSHLAQAIDRILKGSGDRSSIHFEARGTFFQKRVWGAVCHIPFGEMRSYSDIAFAIGCGSPRAIGRALGSNPLPLIIPCHRVVGKGGDLKGFSCGIDIKRILLKFETGIE